MTVQAEAMPARENAAPTFGEAFRVWLKIGCINFGGPAGQIAMMHRMLVDEKKWIDEPRFLHALNFCMLLPGPEAQKLATYVGWALHGVRGGLVAGILFVLPGALVMLALSLAYALGRGIAWIDGALFGIKAAVLVIVVEALLRISRRALKTRLLIALAGAAFIGIFFLNAPFPLIVAGAALIGYLVARTAPERMGLKREAIDVAPAAPDRWRQFFLAFLVGLIVWWAPVLLAALALGPGHVLVSIGTFFSKLAVVSFGGAYALLAYMAQQAVETHHWMTAPEMVDGLRTRRDHARTADPGDAVRRLPRGVPRRGAVLSRDGRHPRRRHDHVGDVHALDAVDLRRCPVRRAVARQPSPVRRTRGDHRGGRRRDPQPHGLVRAPCPVRARRGDARGPLRWFWFDPLALDLKSAALAAIAAILAFRLHRSLIEVVAVMAVLGVVVKLVMG